MSDIIEQQKAKLISYIVSDKYKEIGLTDEQIMEGLKIIASTEGSWFEADDGWNPERNERLEESSLPYNVDVVYRRGKNVPSTVMVSVLLEGIYSDYKKL